MNNYILTSGRRQDPLGLQINGSPVEWMEELLEVGVWGGNADTPHLMDMAKGDRVIIQSAETGFVATAVVQGSARRTRKKLLHGRNCTHEIALKVKHFSAPVQRTAAMRLAISRADHDSPRRRTWVNYFRGGIRPISAKVFSIIARS